MSKFCGTCGSPLTDGQKFCGKCGIANITVQQTAPPTEHPTSASAPPAYAPVASSQPVVTSAPAPARSNTLLKVGIAAVVIIFVGGIAALGAVYYAVHKVKEKVQAAVHQAEGDRPIQQAGFAAIRN